MEQGKEYRRGKLIGPVFTGSVVTISFVLVCLQAIHIHDLQGRVHILDEKLSTSEVFVVNLEPNRVRRSLSGATSCPRGDSGRNGRDGRNGGRGQPGPSGSAGRRGRPGAPGPPGNSLSAAEFQEVLYAVINASSSSSSDVNTNNPFNDNGRGGVTYVRWGRTECREGANMVYRGVAGGKHYTHGGGGSQILCLPPIPQWGKYTDGFQSNSFVYGAEYELAANNPFISTNGEKLHDHDVQCAVCHVAEHASQVMIPAWNTCPAGWTSEYHGYLMAGHYTHQTNSFVCVDEKPEEEIASSPNLNGVLLYPVEAQCGSLPCPGYVAGRELTCAICTK